MKENNKSICTHTLYLKNLKANLKFLLTHHTTILTEESETSSTSMITTRSRYYEWPATDNEYIKISIIEIINTAPLNKSIYIFE